MDVSHIVKVLNEIEEVDLILSSVETKITDSSFLSDFTSDWEEVSLLISTADPYGHGEDAYLTIDVRMKTGKEANFADTAAEHLGDFAAVKLSESLSEIGGSLGAVLDSLLGDISAIVKVQDKYFG